MIVKVLKLNRNTCSGRRNAISKVFNVVFVLIYLDGFSGHWEKALFWDVAALFGVVQPKNLGHYFRVALFGMSLFGVLL